MKTIISALLFALTALSSSAETLTLGHFLKEMADRDRLTRVDETPYLAKLSSSYDRGSKLKENPDGSVEKVNWFANGDYAQFIRTEQVDGRTEAVILDTDKPGVITRLWAPSDRPATVRVYFDGAKEPAITMDWFEFVGGNKVFPKPFSFTPSVLEVNPPWRGRLNFFPIPYAKGCKITIEGNYWYYQVHYREYPSDVKIETFEIDQIEENSELIKAVGEKLTAPVHQVPGKVKNVPAKTLAPGESVQLKLDGGPQSINKLLVSLGAENYQQALRSTVLTLNFDGKQTAWIPVGDFGGVGYSVEKNDTYYMQVDPETGTITSFYMMPFKKSAVVTLTNLGEQDVDIKKFEATVDPYQWEKGSFYFHATWFAKQNIPTNRAHDLTFANVKGGAGRYVGTSITIFNSHANSDGGTWWGEGDEKVYIDGESFPSQFGTGTEDYFGYAYCRPQRFWDPFCSQPRGAGNKDWGYSNNNRYHLLDDIVFTESIKFDMEVLHPFQHNMDYAGAAFYYAVPETTNDTEPDIDGAKHKVSLTVEDVLSSTPSYGIHLPNTPIPDIGKIEGESLSVIKTSAGNFGQQAIGGLGWSNNAQGMWTGAKKGDTLTVGVISSKKGKHSLSMHLIKANDYGMIQVSVNGEKVGKPINLYSKNLTKELIKIGDVNLKNGVNELEIKIVGKDKDAKDAKDSYYFGVDYLGFDAK